MDSDSRSIKSTRRRISNKRVSFSMIDSGITFDEIAKMRKIKEKQLENFILNKKKTNQYISLMKPKNISPSNFNENKNNNNLYKEEIDNINNNNININSSSLNSSSVNTNIKNLKKNSNNKRQMPIRFYLTDEYESKISNTLNSLTNQMNNNNLNNINKVINNKINNKNNSNNNDNMNNNNKTDNNNNIVTFVKIISNIFNMKNNKNKKRKLKKEVFDVIMKYNDILIQKNYLDYEDKDIKLKNFLENKKLFFIRKKAYDNLIQRIKQIKYMKLIDKKNNEEANKFYLYTLYKKKVTAFDALKNYAIKQKIWIQSIQAGLKKELIWSCIDSWKLYVNYKKIKRFLKLRKTKVIFDALRNNKQLSINLLKQGKKMSLILEYRHFFNNVRKSILNQKAKEINNKLLSEFRKQNLMKNLFNILKENHRNEKEKENKYRKMFLTKYEDKDFINIKIFSAETYKINNEFSIKQIQNKIQI